MEHSHRSQKTHHFDNPMESLAYDFSYRSGYIVGALLARNILLEEETIKDPLTNLLNRRGFTEVAELMLTTESEKALVFFDLTNFKYVNDTHGHQKGDEYLQNAAMIISNHLRSDDLLVRFGGDEFVALIDLEPGEDPEYRDMEAQERANTVVKRIQNLFEERLSSSGLNNDVGLGISAGVVLYDRERPVGITELIAQADAALYEQKQEDHKRFGKYRS